MEETISTLRLIRSRNIGPVNFFKLIAKFGSVERALSNIPSANICSKSESEDEIARLEKYGAKYITYNHPKYPKLLKTIYDPPPFISYIGNLDLLNKNICAIVGSRIASLHGINFAGKIASKLSENNVVIASGLANGIDSAAHKSALEFTIAVIAGGIDKIYPAFNKELYQQIAEKGLILAESKIGTDPSPHLFPRRNRIIAGLSKVTLVVEAALKSGSLITAKMAAEMGREVAAIPGHPADFRSKGTNRLIKDGAHMIEDYQDILEIMGIEYNRSKTPQEWIELAISKEPEDSPKRKILSLISTTPIDMNDICAKVNMSIHQVCQVIIPEEIEGNIVRIEGNKFAISS